LAQWRSPLRGSGGLRGHQPTTIMYKEVLRNIDQIAIWPVISFVIFFLFFIILLWWTFTTDKKFINYMSNMPINDDHASNQTLEIKTEKL
jgi:cbb3-type cytochrome oxidase subunit 3